MIYLYSRFRCLIVGDKKMEIKPNVFYRLEEDISNSYILYGYNKEYPVAINFAELINGEKYDCANVVIVNSKTFIFLNLKPILENNVVMLKLQNKDYCLSISNQVNLSVNGELILDKQINAELNYSNFEQIGEFYLIYLKGETNFVIILKNAEVLFADFYNEINVCENERTFMLKLNDALNHGRVATIKNKEFESYLVYLDDNELNMQNDFTFLIFLDCFVAGNFNYCNNLLADDIKQAEAKNITKFFEPFDFYVPFGDVVFTFKKNTLSGVYEFVVENNKILNIIHLTQH